MWLIIEQNNKITNKHASLLFLDGGGDVRAGAGAAERGTTETEGGVQRDRQTARDTHSFRHGPAHQLQQLPEVQTTRWGIEMRKTMDS